MFCTYKTFHPNGLFYIGKATYDKVANGKYRGSGLALGLAFKKFDKSEWTTIILDVFENQQDAYDAEAALVTAETLKNPLCLNVSLGGGNPQVISPERRKQMVEKAKQTVKLRRETDPTFKMGHHIPHTDQTKQKLRERKLGTTLSPESINKREATKIANGSHRGGKPVGTIVTKQTRSKISDALKGHTVKDETRLKIAEAKKNTPKVECPECKQMLPPGNLTRHQGSVRCQAHARKVAHDNVKGTT